MHISHSRRVGYLAIGVLLLLSACAFDVVYLQETPAQLTAFPDTGERWTLQIGTRATLPAGRASALRPGTVWQRVGTIDQGEVFRTQDQILTVEASNLYQADLVIKDGQLVGFYLPVDHLFARCSGTVPISLIKSVG